MATCFYKILFGIVLFTLPTYVTSQKLKTQQTKLFYIDSLKKAFVKTEKTDDLLKIIRASIYILQGNKLDYLESTEVLQFFLLKVKEKEKKEALLPYLHNGLGSIYEPNQNSKLLATDYLLGSLEAIKKLGDAEWLGITYQQLGSLMYEIGDFKSALCYFAIAEKNISALSLPKTVRTTSIYNTYALTLQKSAKMDSAMIYYEKALQYAEEIKDTIWIGLLSGNIGVMYYEQKRYEEARSALEKDVEISLHYALNTNAVISLSDIVKVYIGQKKVGEAKKILAKSVEILKKIAYNSIDLPAYIHHYEASMLYYEAVNDFQQAFAYQTKYRQTENAYRKYTKDIEVQRIKIGYNYETTQQNVTKLTKQNKNQQIYLYLIGLTLIMLIVLLIIITQRFYEKKTWLRKLKIQHTQINEINIMLLESTVQSATQATMIEEKNKALQASNLSKDKIFALVSHDLRNPLGSLIGIIELLKSNDLSIEELQEIVPTIEANLSTAFNLSEEVLYWASVQMKGGRINATHFNPIDIIQATINSFEASAYKKSVKLVIGQLSSAEMVHADENMVKAVIRNLVANALKFCHADAFITIFTETAIPNFVTFVVKDTGIGIKTEHLPYILQDEPFSTKGTAGEKGTGFGLMLCKDFVTQNGGKIWVESVWGEGTLFYFTLPTAMLLQTTEKTFL